MELRMKHVAFYQLSVQPFVKARSDLLWGTPLVEAESRAPPQAAPAAIHQSCANDALTTTDLISTLAAINLIAARAWETVSATGLAY